MMIPRPPRKGVVAPRPRKDLGIDLKVWDKLKGQFRRIVIDFRIDVGS